MMKKISATILVLSLLSFSFLWSGSAMADIDYEKSYDKRPEVKAFIAEMVVKHGYTQEHLMRLFSQVKPKRKILEAMSKPAERTLNWTRYRKIFLKQDRIAMAVDFWKENEEILAKAAKEFGVPEEIMVGILAVETKFGRVTGKHTVFDSLATLAFDGKRRNKFFRGELESLLIMAKEEGFDARSIKGSYAGAMGMPQFISSSYRAYAIDYDGDDKRDLFGSIPDVVGSVANYFKRHGWVEGAPITQPIKPTRSMVKNDTTCGAYGVRLNSDVASIRKKGIQVNTSYGMKDKATILCLETNDANEYWLGLKNFYVISRYNHSVMYSMAVYQLSEEIKKSYLGK